MSCCQGDAADVMYFVEDGQVRIAMINKVRILHVVTSAPQPSLCSCVAVTVVDRLSGVGLGEPFHLSHL